MRALLDENLPHDLSGALTGHVVSTVQGLGWAGTKNGALGSVGRVGAAAGRTDRSSGVVHLSAIIRVIS